MIFRSLFPHPSRSAGARRLVSLVAGTLLAVATATSALAERACGGTSLFEGPDGASLKASVEAMADKVNTGATFWKIEVPGGKARPSYLLGTIHLTDERITALPAAVEKALGTARILAVENATSLNPNPSGKDLQVMVPLTMYTDGRTLRQGLSQDEMDKLTAALSARGLPIWAILGLRPWAVVVTALAYPPCEMKRISGGETPFLDAALVRRMKAADRPVASLEELSEQLGSIAAIPEDLQFSMLKTSLRTEHLIDDLHETMVQLYLKGEIGKLIGLSKVLMAKYDPGVDYGPFWRQTLDLRNLRMRDHAVPLIREGNAFLAVGAGHLIGESGLVALLRKEGFRVQPVR